MKPPQTNWGNRAVDKTGTLVIRRQQTNLAGHSSRPVYTIMLLTSPSERQASAHRCAGDFALLRALEELMVSPELRLETLERVRDQGEAMVRDVVVEEPILAKYGLAPRPRREAVFRVDRHSRVLDQPCAVCSLPTRPIDRLTMLSGEVVHYDCRPESRDITDIAARFLAESDGRAVCHSCLARQLHAAFDEVRKVVGRLRARTGLSVGTGQCSVCGRYRVILGTRATQELEDEDLPQR
jgi:hypothetical protein